jgi:hypothetical protein
MIFSLVFENTGDSIPFRTISNQTADVLSYYVDNLNKQNLNKFTNNNIGNKINQTIANLNSTIINCNEFIYELLDQHIDTCTTEEYLNQQILNKLHADWVKSQTVKYNILEKRKKYNYSQQSELIHSMFPDEIPEPPVGVIIDKLGVAEQYSNINVAVHKLELLFSEIKFQVADQNWVEFTNPFGKDLLTNDVSNFSLAFNHLGRTLYNKFVYFDHTLEYHDENSFDELLGFVELGLAPAQTIPLSVEYVDWCKIHNKIPSGDRLPIGNIPDLATHLTDYRKIIFRNTRQNNFFSIQLNKGN